MVIGGLLGPKLVPYKMTTSPGLVGVDGPSKLPSARVAAMYLSLSIRKNAGVNYCIHAIAAARADPRLSH